MCIVSKVTFLIILIAFLNLSAYIQMYQYFKKSAYYFGLFNYPQIYVWYFELRACSIVFNTINKKFIF